MLNHMMTMDHLDLRESYLVLMIQEIFVLDVHVSMHREYVTTMWMTDSPWLDALNVAVAVP